MSTVAFGLLSILFFFTQRSLASFPTPVVEEEPQVAVAAEPIAHAHVAPVVASVPAVAPAPYYPSPVLPYAVHTHYYHPRTELHNVVKSYAKESGHASATSVVSENGHLPGGLGLHPTEHHLSDALALPFRARLHRQKHAKKSRKSFDKKSKN